MMLFDEVAIQPECVCDELVLEALRHRFGWSQGRVVCAVPPDWTQRVRQLANTLPDGLTKSRIKDIGSRLPLVAPHLSYTKQSSWREAVLDLHQRHPFDGVILREPPIEPGWYSPERIDDYLDTSEERIGHYELTRQNPPDIVKALYGFLHINKRLVLVNAYQWFFTAPRNTALFFTMMKTWTELGGVQFRVIRSRRKDFARWGAECERLAALLREIHFKGQFSFIAVDDEADRLHERYLIGSICGLELGYGLEISSKPQSWKLLRQSSHAKLKQLYMDHDIRDAYPAHETWNFTSR